MTSLEQLTRRIDELESREAIRALVYCYTELIRSARHSDAAALYTEDALFELHHADPRDAGASTLQRRWDGGEAILASFSENAGEQAQIWPMIHNLRIDLDGDAARSTCVMMAAIWPQGHQFVGEYRDRYRRTPAGWRFCARTYVLFGEVRGTYAAQSHENWLDVKA